jgi:hypothetical protein
MRISSVVLWLLLVHVDRLTDSHDEPKRCIMWDLRFSQLWLWRILSSGIYCCVVHWSQAMFQRSMLLPSSLSKKYSKLCPFISSACCLPYADALLAWRWSDMFLQNTDWLSMDYMMSYPRRELVIHAFLQFVCCDHAKKKGCKMISQERQESRWLQM